MYIYLTRIYAHTHKHINKNIRIYVYTYVHICFIMCTHILHISFTCLHINMTECALFVVRATVRIHIYIYIFYVHPYIIRIYIHCRIHIFHYAHTYVQVHISFTCLHINMTECAVFVVWAMVLFWMYLLIAPDAAGGHICVPRVFWDRNV